MKSGYAFEFKDLTVLLGLELTEPADHADIEAINTILNRRRRPTPPSLRSKETGTGQHSTWFPTAHPELITPTRRRAVLTSDRGVRLVG